MNYSPGSDDIMAARRPRRTATLLLWAIVAFILVFFAWAALAKVDRSVRGSGRVVASSQLQIVSNLEGGVVEALLVRPGEEVRRGQPLLRLDPTSSGSELGSSEAATAALAARVARLRSEVTGTRAAFPVGLGEQGRAEAALQGARSADFSSLVAAAEARITGARRAVAEAEAAYRARQSAAEARRREIGPLRSLVEKGIEPRLALTQAESAAAVATSEAAEAAAGVARARSTVAEAQASLAQQRSDWRARAAEELASAQAELAARRTSLPALAERVERTVVRAPLPGRVNRLLVSTVGAAVSPSQPLIEIAPSGDSLLIETRIRPQDIALVRQGQPARIGITAYDPSIHGRLNGVVVSISPDAVIEERTQQSYYIVQVRAQGQLRGPAGRPLEIGTGMVADVSLLGERRSVLSYIFSPIARLGDTALRE